MATASVTHTFNPLTDILSSEANTNFQDLVSFLNSQVIHKDGSVAATGHLSGPLADPVAAGQYTNKQYVDRLGVVARQTLTTTSVGYSSDIVTDMALNNVPVVAGRTYGIHLHASYTSSAVAEWSLMCRVNGVDIGRFGWIPNIGGAINGLLDGTVYWVPMVTAATDDITVFADEISGASTLTLNAAATTPRTLALIDLGVL